MCGRATADYSAEDLAALSGVDPATVKQPEPRYNVAPMQPVRVLRHDANGKMEVLEMRWGFVPHWAKDPAKASPMINARCETIAQKPTFRDAFHDRRCIMPTSGFYEWRREDKQPFYIQMKDESLFALAGIWDKTGNSESFAIVTTEANSVVAEYHDRMPVIIAKKDVATWLDPKTDPETLKSLMVPFDPAAMKVFPVSKRVNKVGNDGPENVQPATDEMLFKM